METIFLSAENNLFYRDLIGSPSLYDRWIEFVPEKEAKAPSVDRIPFGSSKSPQRSASVSPRKKASRSGSVSPRRKASPSRLPDISSTLSQFIEAADYQKFGGGPIIDDVPEREWRLLEILARKRDEDLEREKLADDFRRMWEKEKAERDLVAAVSTNQYKRYIHAKREQEKLLQDFRNCQRETEDKIKKVLLVDSIRDKEKRSANVLNWTQDLKAQEKVGKALEQEARGILAADRRTKKVAAEEWKRRTELEDGLRRLEDAQKKRDSMIKNASKRAAITNALNSWESMILKQEAVVVEDFKRAQHAARAELTTLRSMRIARTRALREQRARHVAAFTQQLRDAVRMTR